MASQRDTINAIDTWLTSKHSPMAGFADCMVWMARRSGVAITLSLAIAQAETQCGTDPNADQDDIKGHNAWGYGHSPGSVHGWLFPSWPDGISAVTDWLARGYIYQGLTTVEAVCVKWVGQFSQTWVDNVSATMRQFGGDPEKLARTPLMVHGDGVPPAIMMKEGT